MSLLDEMISDATLTISHIRNWNSSANILYIHLLDTAKKPGVATYADDPSGVAPPTDNFLDPGLADNRLVASGTGNILLVDPSFTVIPMDYAYHLTGPQLEALMADIRNGGDFALGFDPDCHYFNNGITLTITAIPSSNPESPSIVLLGSGLLVSMKLLRRKTRKQV